MTEYGKVEVDAYLRVTIAALEQERDVLREERDAERQRYDSVHRAMLDAGEEIKVLWARIASLERENKRLTEYLIWIHQKSGDGTYLHKMATNALYSDQPAPTLPSLLDNPIEETK